MYSKRVAAGSSRRRAVVFGLLAGMWIACVDSTPPAESKRNPADAAEPQTEVLSSARFNRLVWEVRRSSASLEGCDAGDLVQCFALAHTRERTGDRSGAMAFYRKACSIWRKDPFPCVIGLDERKGESHSPHAIGCFVPYDGTQEAAAYARGCVGHCRGEASCEALLEHHCLQDVSACRRACRRGDASKCRVLAGMSAEGLGVAKNPVQAEALYQKACEAGDRWSCRPTGPFHAHPKQMPNTMP